MVGVAALDDFEAEGDHGGVLTHRASGGGYDTVAIPLLAVGVADNDLFADLFADLAIDAVHAPSTAHAGDTIDFDIEVSNHSQVLEVRSADFDFHLTPALQNVRWNCVADTGALCPASGDGLPAHPLSLPPGKRALYRVSAEVPASATPGTTIMATAGISAGEPYTDANDANDHAVAAIVVAAR